MQGMLALSLVENPRRISADHRHVYGLFMHFECSSALIATLL